ncbi:uncharacterized protein Tco025E_07426 [Trypanosoma conorhini]|uniref:Uncharacterized protein n=1 Tax=Trypanosoma conorhini TaxID=83891 RepID=A0A422NP43_9TRYP|nr:uncharacterized protein Tco025E_07426 [Trypanosoma conorhini]RNF07159.1 hypothetical protein Tco025E_07426 [Trypanosoma conorhini]
MTRRSEVAAESRRFRRAAPGHYAFLRHCCGAGWHQGCARRAFRAALCFFFWGEPRRRSRTEARAGAGCVPGGKGDSAAAGAGASPSGGMRPCRGMPARHALVSFAALFARPGCTVLRAPPQGLRDAGGGTSVARAGRPASVARGAASSCAPPGRFGWAGPCRSGPEAGTAGGRNAAAGPGRTD